MRALIIVLICTASAIFAPFACAQSGGAGTAIVVLDGSGSMGGPLDGQTDVKFDMASRALLQLLPTAAAQSRTGLVTFGNRRKGDCGDADTAILPTSGNLDQFSSVFARIGPTGKGPLVHGVRTAAKSLPPDAPGTLIVIHDDMDNCRQDVCAAAADLAKISPKITVHVITISLDKTTSEKMSCLATATGGRVFEARDAASVESSLADALRLAGVIDASARPSTEVPTANVPAPIIEPLGPPSVRLSAGLGPEGLAADYIFFDADMGHDGMFPWDAGQPPVPMIALIGSEAPGRIEWSLKAGAHAQLLKPVGDNGAYSALLIARDAFDAQKALSAEIADLRRRLEDRQTVVRAVTWLAARGKSEAEAFAQLRQMAMAWRISFEDAAARIVASHGGGDDRHQHG